MYFEEALERTGSANNDREFEEILNEYLEPGQISESSLWKAMPRIFYGARAVDVMIVDSDER